jgi:hypothetical protein
MLASFTVVALLFALMFKWLPDVSVAWGDVWLGALLTALFFELGKAAIGLYIGKQGLESTYGAAGFDCGGADLGVLHIANHPNGRRNYLRLFETSPSAAERQSLGKRRSGKRRLRIRKAIRQGGVINRKQTAPLDEVFSLRCNAKRGIDAGFFTDSLVS